MQVTAVLPGLRNITCYAGDTLVFYYTLRKAVPDTDPVEYELVDITGYSFAGQVRENYEAAPTDFTATVTGAATNGRVRFHLTSAQTAALNETGAEKTYVYDIQSTHTESGLEIVQTLTYGEFLVRPEVTRVP